ncbi:hypothetical protein BC829DRAFT_446278 [Chytridium lagenaria]|nr:hypothetical protein BC829DRAFT_446278 [Chytridium lagenaria]
MATAATSSTTTTEFCTPAGPLSSTTSLVGMSDDLLSVPVTFSYAGSLSLWVTGRQSHKSSLENTAFSVSNHITDSETLSSLSSTWSIEDLKQVVKPSDHYFHDKPIVGKPIAPAPVFKYDDMAGLSQKLCPAHAASPSFNNGLQQNTSTQLEPAEYFPNPSDGLKHFSHPRPLLNQHSRSVITPSPPSPPIPPEHHVLNPKQPKTLRILAILRHWEAGRMARWWAWRDAVLMAAIKEEEVRKENRRKFLSRLRTHPWVETETTSGGDGIVDQEVSPITPSAPPLPDEKPQDISQKALSRRPSTFRIKTSTTQAPSPTTPLPTPPTDALTVRANAVERLRAARGGRERDRSTQVLLKVGDHRDPPPEIQPFEKHRSALVGRHAGVLPVVGKCVKQCRGRETCQSDATLREMAARKKLVESRRRVRNEVDVLVHRANLRIEAMQAQPHSSVPLRRPSPPPLHDRKKGGKRRYHPLSDSVVASSDGGKAYSKEDEIESRSKSVSSDQSTSTEGERVGTTQVCGNVTPPFEMLLTMRKRIVAQQKALNAHPPEDAVLGMEWSGFDEMGRGGIPTV